MNRISAMRKGEKSEKWTVKEGNEWKLIKGKIKNLSYIQHNIDDSFNKMKNNCYCSLPYSYEIEIKQIIN